MSIRKIKIFIGSSIEDLKDERKELVCFLTGLNNKYIDQGIYIEPYFCEVTSSAMSLEGSQFSHNEYIENEADFTIFMFFRKAGQYTMEEMEIARKTFLEKKDRPNLLVFFKTIDKEPADTEEIKACVDKVANEYGHYYRLFESADTIKMELLQCLVDSLQDGSELAVHDGRVLLNGVPLSEEMIQVKNVFAYQNNAELRRLNDEKDRLLKQMAEASEKGDISGALKASAQLDEVQKKFNKLEEDILDVLKAIYEENKKGEKADPLRIQALRYLEMGMVEEAKALVPLDMIIDETEKCMKKRELTEEILQDEEESPLEKARIRIMSLEMEGIDKAQSDEIQKIYEQTIELAKKSEDYIHIYKYAEFLNSQKKYKEAIQYAEFLKSVYDSPFSVLEQTDVNKALILFLLGQTYANLDYPQDTEDTYKEALELFERMAETGSKEKCGPYLAKLYNDLALYYDKTNRKPEEVERLYLEALDIDQYLVEKVSKERYEPEMAKTYDNLAYYCATHGKPQEALDRYQKAIDIYERYIKEMHREEYLPFLASVYNNLAYYHEKYGIPEEAERLYQEALDIYNRLAETVSLAVYEPGIARVNNNLASFYNSLDETPEKVEQLYLKASEIYHRLAKEVSKEEYDPYVALICFNLGIFYEGQGKTKEAESIFLEALGIYHHLTKDTNKEFYEPKVAETYFELAYLNEQQGEPSKMEEFYLKALEIYRRLTKEVNAKEYGPVAERICNTLADHYKKHRYPEKAKRMKQDAHTFRQITRETERR